MSVSRTVFITALGAALVFAPLAARAAGERIVRVSFDGRPIAKPGVVVAVARNGVVFGDLIALTRAFAGLVTLDGAAVKASVGPTTATFTAGSRTLEMADGTSLVMPGTPFLRAGTLFVPLQTFVHSVAQANVTIDAGARIAAIRVAVPQ